MSYWYLASPYAAHPGGLSAAFEDACRAAALLLRAGVPTFSPIAHGHAVAWVGQPGGDAHLDPVDHATWAPLNEPLMAAARGCVVLDAPGRAASVGVAYEVGWFREAGRPTVTMTPGTVPAELRAWQRDREAVRVEGARRTRERVLAMAAARGGSGLPAWMLNGAELAEARAAHLAGELRLNDLTRRYYLPAGHRAP